jgi:hypothetical protein
MHREEHSASHYNVLHAFNPVPSAHVRGGEAFSARLEAERSWRPDGRELVLSLRVTNTGLTHWRAARWHPFPDGSVTVSPYLPGPRGHREVELRRFVLPGPLSPGESACLELRVSRERAQGRGEIAVDLVREGVFWFGDVGSEPLVVPVPA